MRSFRPEIVNPLSKCPGFEAVASYCDRGDGFARNSARLASFSYSSAMISIPRLDSGSAINSAMARASLARLRQCSGSRTAGVVMYRQADMAACSHAGSTFTTSVAFRASKTGHCYRPLTRNPASTEFPQVEIPPVERANGAFLLRAV
jgi:hypothetical protein